jgi:hypothetical protein
MWRECNAALARTERRNVLDCGLDCLLWLDAAYIDRFDSLLILIGANGMWKMPTTNHSLHLYLYDTSKNNGARARERERET